jgi:geranylgeranyl reductase family protein
MVLPTFADQLLNMLKTDICIIGAGPAGATASIFLCKMGIPHTIVDAATFPRDKICGDGLDLKVFRVMRHIDPDLTAKEIFGNEDFLQSWGVRVFTPNRKHILFNQKEALPDIQHPIAWTSKRFNFDQFLVDKINPQIANIHWGTKVNSLKKDNEGWIIKAKGPDGDMEIRSKLVIGADGDHSVLLHHLGERKIDRRHYAAAVRQYWKGVADMHPDNLLEAYFPDGKEMSYFWIFPLPNGEMNVGYGMVSEVASKKKFNIRETMQSMIETDPILKDRFKNATPLEEIKGWGIPFASRRRKCFGDGYLLLGDAASMNCPTNGEGIGTSMISGYIAAQFIQEAYKANRYDADMFKNFDRELYRRMEDEIKLYDLVRKYMPLSLYDPMINIFFHNPLLLTRLKNRTPKWFDTAYNKKLEVSI